MEINLLFNLSGFISIILFYKILKKLGLSQILSILRSLLPSLHFFTSSVGKDVLVLMGFMMVIYGSINLDLNYDKKIFLIILGFILLLLIRPYIFLIFYLFIFFSTLIFISKNKLLFFIGLNFIFIMIYLVLHLNQILCFFLYQFCH